MKIISAVDYGDRVVIRVCHNPSDPKWVHLVGSQLRDSVGARVFNDSGGPVLITSSVVGDGENGNVCHNCRYNWDVTEVIFDGAELLDSQFLRRSDDDLAAAALARSEKLGAVRPMPGILG